MESLSLEMLKKKKRCGIEGHGLVMALVIIGLDLRGLFQY